MFAKVKEMFDKESRIKELEEYALNLTNKAARLELEKKEAEEAADLAQTHSFGLGYNEAVAEAKKMGWDYKKILLNPNEDPTIQAFQGRYRRRIWRGARVDFIINLSFL